MRKYIIIFLILVACQPEELMEVQPLPQYEMIFEESKSSVTDGQEFSFEVVSEEEHQLVISKDGSVISKESFLPTLDINTKKIYTKSLPIDLLQLELINSNGVIKSVLLYKYINIYRLNVGKPHNFYLKCLDHTGNILHYNANRLFNWLDK